MKPKPTKGRAGKAVGGRRPTKSEAKRTRGKARFDRNWLTSPNNPVSSPYWTPPYMEVDLTYASMLFMDKDGTPVKDKFVFTGSKVTKIGGDFSRLGIDEKGLAEDLQKAIDEVIRQHTKLEPSEKPTRIAPEG